MFFLIIPFRIDRTFRLPVATIVLIAINVSVFAISLTDLEGFVTAGGFTSDLSGLYTWLTSMFLHADIFHLGWNMLYLWVFGSVVEDAAGRVRFLLLYFAGGLCAVLTHAAVEALFMPAMGDIPLIGASGAVAAIMGVFAVRMYRHKLELWFFVWVLIFIRTGTVKIASWIAIGIWLLNEIISGLPALAGIPSGVANWAHIGGLLFGAALAAAFGLAREAGTEGLAETALQQQLAGDHVSAVSAYRRLAADEPDNPDWLLGKIRTQVNAGRADGLTATRDVTRAIKLLLARGERAAAADAYLEFRGRGVELGLDRASIQALASTCESDGRLDVAVRLFYELATEHPNTREGERAHFRLAHVYLRQGRDELARQAWESYVGTYPHSEWTSFADKRLLEIQAGWDYRAPSSDA